MLGACLAVQAVCLIVQARTLVKQHYRIERLELDLYGPSAAASVTHTPNP